jgi:hypothetical protein
MIHELECAVDEMKSHRELEAYTMEIFLAYMNGLRP